MFKANIIIVCLCMSLFLHSWQKSKKQTKIVHKKLKNFADIGLKNWFKIDDIGNF